MKVAELRFVLESEFDQQSLQRALKADKAYKALYDIQQLLRQHDKYGQTEKDLETYIASLRIEIRQLVIETGVDLESEYT